MRITSLLILTSCAAVPLRVASTPATLEAPTLAGTWHVVASNFPMWTQGNRTNPTFHYGVLGAGRLSDTVRYLEGATTGFIEGTDLQSASIPTHFTWRGTGLLVFFTSEWDVVALGDDWAIIYFSSTPATPEGVDVITRLAQPTAQTVDTALALITQDPLLRLKATGLKRLVTP
jgi:hypothetical protein